MIGHLPDSTVQIHWLRGEKAVIDWLDAATAGIAAIVTSAVSVAEIYALARAPEISRYDDYFHEMDVIPVTAAIARAAGLMRSNLRATGLQLHLADALIGATAVELGLPVVTANVRDFAIAGIDVIPLGPAPDA